MRGLHGWAPFGCCMKVSPHFLCTTGGAQTTAHGDALFPGKITQETTPVVVEPFLEVLSEQK